MKGENFPGKDLDEARYSGRGLSVTGQSGALLCEAPAVWVRIRLIPSVRGTPFTDDG